MPARRILHEAMQFVLLEELSLHLSAYFDLTADVDLVHELGRSDVPMALLNNRVLDLLCKPIEERDVFLRAFPDQGGRPPGEIYMLQCADGSSFSRFDMVLPVGSSINIRPEGQIEVKTKRLSLNLRGSWHGTNAVVPPLFIEKYMGRSWKDITALGVRIEIWGQVNAFSLITNFGWQYYGWLDSFRAELQERFDFETFLRTINWRTIETLILTRRHDKKLESGASRRGTPGSSNSAQSKEAEPKPTGSAQRPPQ